MQLYLINPSNPLVSIVKVKESRWNRYRVWKPLSLMVLAGLTPPSWEITIIDENLGLPDYPSMPRPDLVGITALTSQANRAYKVAAHFRNIGVPVVMGGIHATMCLDEVMERVDSVVTGEAEVIWQQVLDDALHGNLKRCYDGGLADINDVPLARHDLLAAGYAFGAIQTTRGCPRYKHALALYPYFGVSNVTMGIFPPTGLEYIVASMKDLVGKITLLDLRHERAYQDLTTLSKLIRDCIDLLCISIQWHSRFEQVCDFISQLPHKVCTVVGGYKATQEAEYLFDHCPNVDVIVRGEGEDIIKQIVTGVPYKDIRGLSYRQNERIVHNEIHPLPDITRIPFPDRSLRKHDYRAVVYGVRVSSHTFDTVLTTRGCPFKCKFCTFSLNPLGQKRSYTERPVESVIEELKTVEAGVVLFSDDNFFTNPKRTEELCDMIIENNIKKTFIVQTRIDIAKYPRVLEKAERAGVKVFLIGIESPHDWILKQLQKGITQQEVKDAFAVLTQYDFYLHGYFIYGNIGETEEEMLYIPKFAKEIKLDSISFQKLRIEKFSPLKEVVEATPGYYCDRIGGPVYSDRYGHKELKQIRNRIRSEFYDLAQIIHIIRKAGRIGLFSWRDLRVALPNLPLLMYRLARRKRRKKK